MNIFEVAFTDVWGYNFIIIALGILTFIAYIFLLLPFRRLKKNLFVPNDPEFYTYKDLHKYYQTFTNKKNCQELDAKIRRMDHVLQILSSFTVLFPLLGITGTVISILLMNNLDSELVQTQFHKALTSTLWGLVFAMALRSIESFIAPGIQDMRDKWDRIKEIYYGYCYRKGDCHEENSQ